jgi:hypothetical protein
MIYSKKHNFVVIRTPKSGSVAVGLYLLDSGLLNRHRDIVSMPRLDPSFIREDGTIHLDSFVPGEPLNTYGNPVSDAELVKRVISQTHQIDLSHSAICKRQLLHSDHTSHCNALERGLVAEDVPCFSAIRNPVDRWLSALNYTVSVEEITKYGVNDLSLSILEKMKSYRDQNSAEETVNPPVGISILLYFHQKRFFSKDATLWPLERLHECMVDFIEPLGGRVRGNWIGHVSKTRDRSTRLSAETELKIKEYFADDMALWESVI